jgi:hypothetical protein
MEVVGLLALSCLLGLIPASIAKNKGHSFGAWWLYGFLIFIVALPHSIIIRPGTPPYDRTKWDALVRYDPDIKRIVEVLSQYDTKYVDQFASAFMALNDKAYLPQIIEDILARAKADALAGATADAARTIYYEGAENSFSWRQYSDGIIEGRIDGQWTRISSVTELRKLPLARSV